MLYIVLLRIISQPLPIRFCIAVILQMLHTKWEAQVQKSNQLKVLKFIKSWPQVFLTP